MHVCLAPPFLLVGSLTWVHSHTLLVLHTLLSGQPNWHRAVPHSLLMGQAHMWVPQSFASSALSPDRAAPQAGMTAFCWPCTFSRLGEPLLYTAQWGTKSTSCCPCFISLWVEGPLCARCGALLFLLCLAPAPCGSARKPGWSYAHYPASGETSTMVLGCGLFPQLLRALVLPPPSLCDHLFLACCAGAVQLVLSHLLEGFALSIGVHSMCS